MIRFSDITIWCKECYRKYKVYGLEEVEWVAKSLVWSYSVWEDFSLNHLFWDQKLAQKYHLLTGEKVLNVHIPAGEKLDYCECQNLLNQLRNFLVTKM